MSPFSKSISPLWQNFTLKRPFLVCMAQLNVVITASLMERSLNWSPIVLAAWACTFHWGCCNWFFETYYEQSEHVSPSHNSQVDSLLRHDDIDDLYFAECFYVLSCEFTAILKHEIWQFFEVVWKNQSLHSFSFFFWFFFKYLKTTVIKDKLN